MSKSEEIKEFLILKIPLEMLKVPLAKLIKDKMNVPLDMSTVPLSVMFCWRMVPLILGVSWHV